MGRGPDAVAIECFDSERFCEFCDVIEIGDLTGKPINQGLCTRYSDLARLDFCGDGRAGISLFQAELRTIPLRLELMERHPFGSQTFIPMSQSSMLVVVSPDDGARPGQPRACIIEQGRAVNLLRNVWHGVLTPLSGSGLYSVVDWIGDKQNLVEYRFDTPLQVNR